MSLKLIAIEVIEEEDGNEEVGGDGWNLRGKEGKKVEALACPLSWFSFLDKFVAFPSPLVYFT